MPIVHTHTQRQQQTHQVVQYHPDNMRVFQGVRGATSDFADGFIEAHGACYGAKANDKYKMVDGVVTATCTCFLRLCSDHALVNLTGPGRTGRAKLRDTGDKEFTANILRGRLDFAFRRLTLTLFDVFMRWLLHELPVGSLGPAIGRQATWAEYLQKEYHFSDDQLIKYHHLNW